MARRGTVDAAGSPFLRRRRPSRQCGGVRGGRNGERCRRGTLGSSTCRLRAVATARRDRRRGPRRRPSRSLRGARRPSGVAAVRGNAAPAAGRASWDACIRSLQGRARRAGREKRAVRRLHPQPTAHRAGRSRRGGARHADRPRPPRQAARRLDSGAPTRERGSTTCGASPSYPMSAPNSPASLRRQTRPGRWTLKLRRLSKRPWTYSDPTG